MHSGFIPPIGALQPSMREILSRDVTLLTCRQQIIVKVNIMGEIFSRDVTLPTCRQKIIVKVNIMGEILSCDITLLTCRQKIIVKVNIMGEIRSSSYSRPGILSLNKVNIA